MKLCSIVMAHVIRMRGKPSSEVLAKVAKKIESELREPAVSYIQVFIQVFINIPSILT